MKEIRTPAYIDAKKRVKEIKEFYNHLLVFLIVNLMIGLVVWYYDGPMNFFLIFCVGSWAVGVMIHALKTLRINPFLGKNWEERKLKELLEKEE